MAQAGAVKSGLTRSGKLRRGRKPVPPSTPGQSAAWEAYRAAQSSADLAASAASKALDVWYAEREKGYAGIVREAAAERARRTRRGGGRIQ